MFSVINDEAQRNELEEFYKNNKNCFLNIAYTYLHNKSDAEDAVQEAFSEIIRKPDNFFSIAPKNRVSFMVAVVRNISSDMFNKKNKVPLEELDEENSYDDNPFPFEDSMIGKVSRDMLKHFIKSLPPLQRDVLTLRCLMGFSTAETADKLNISQSAVKKRLRLAKAAVCEYVRKEDDSLSFYVYTLYENTSSEQVITLSQYTKEKFTSHYNTEHDTFEEIEINGHNGVSLDFSDYGHFRSVVIWDNGDYILEIIGDLSKNRLINLAKSAKVLEN